MRNSQVTCYSKIKPKNRPKIKIEAVIRRFGYIFNRRIKENKNSTNFNLRLFKLFQTVYIKNQLSEVQKNLKKNPV